MARAASAIACLFHVLEVQGRLRTRFGVGSSTGFSRILFRQSRDCIDGVKTSH